MIVDQTYGEKRVQTILEQLPINEFYCYVEPRVDRKDQESRYPDFLIIWRAKGVLAVEVKDWVKLNAERCDQREVEIIKRNGEVLKKENPARTAKRYADNLMDLFEKRRELTSTYNGLEKLSFPCQGIAILPNIDGNTLSGFETSGVFPEYKVFSGDVLGNVEIFRKVLKTVRWTWDLRSPLNDEVVNIIQHTIKLTAINLHKDGDIHVIGSKIGSLNKKQEEFVYMPLPAQDAGLSVDLLRGPAGSGKTIVLAKRAELLAEVRPNLKILVTAFNLDLTDDLRKRINNPNVQVTPFFDICKKILGDQWPCIEDYRNERGPATIKGWVRNHQELISELGLEIDDVALEISRRKDVPLITDADYFEDVHSRKLPLSHNQQEAICAMFDLYHEYQETMRLQGKDCADYEDIPDLTLNALFGHKLERSYDIIMIDEAQDWAPKWIKIIKRLLKAGGYLFICDDPAQSLWRFFDWKQKGIKNYTPYHLQLPERTTREIMDCAQSLFDIDERIHFEQDTDVYPVKTDHLISGNKPIVLQFTSTEEEISKILSRIDQWLSQGMKGKQIAILCPCFADTRLWIKQELIKNNDVYVGHFNQMKGLEFNTVFIPQIDGAFVKEDGRLSATSSIAAMRRLFVAMTRARENLILSSSKSFPEILTPLFKYSSVENW